MFERQDVLTTLRMVQEENLDVRTVTLGINLNGCATRDPDALVASVRRHIATQARDLVRFCDEMAARYGLPIVNKRVAVSPVSILLEGHSIETAVRVAQAMDLAAEDVHVDLIGGFSALVQKGITPGERVLIESIPTALSCTQRVCASLNVGTTRAGLNVDAVRLAAAQIRGAAEASHKQRGFAAAKLVIFANM